MGRDVPSGTGIKRKFDDTAAACSGESPACNAKKLSTGPLEVGMSTNLEVVEGGAADAADSLGDLARHQRICLLCTLPCLLAEAGYPKQQHLEATCAYHELGAPSQFNGYDIIMSMLLDHMNANKGYGSVREAAFDLSE
ncbi:hypothetical protein HPB52_013780 [Rhipicephalus sanguineus]|uniref:Uncharacterized protein n=1 Tax=Rhipicephalus sanguineus TaxID=34632 RepID=A0A9D4YQ29_RHISA|nr:hypothetical protein HPB52_013780 [Rhipicephalus sanguineus]